MRHLIFVNSINSGQKKDGDEFFRQAMQYKAFHESEGDEITLVNFKYAYRSALPKVMDALNADAFFDVVAFFGHGTQRSLLSFGLNMRVLKNMENFYEALSGALVSTGRVLLFCCSCGAPEGIAKDIAARADRDVWAHNKAGHVTRNPCAGIYYKTGYSTQVHDMLPPEEWEKWKRLRRADDKILKFEAPLMSLTGIKSHLEGLA